MVIVLMEVCPLSTESQADIELKTWEIDPVIHPESKAQLEK
jgi:hypothetical protein